MTGMARIGYARSSTYGSFSVEADAVEAEAVRLANDPGVRTVYFYLDPAGPATWVKGDGALHRRITESINTLAR